MLQLFLKYATYKGRFIERKLNKNRIKTGSGGGAAGLRSHKRPTGAWIIPSMDS
jgi:hypothetical protein